MDRVVEENEAVRTRYCELGVCVWGGWVGGCCDVCL